MDRNTCNGLKKIADLSEGAKLGLGFGALGLSVPLLIWLASKMDTDEYKEDEFEARSKYKGKLIDKIVVSDPDTYEERSVRVTPKNKLTEATLKQIQKAFEQDKKTWTDLSPEDAKHLKIGGITRLMFSKDEEDPEHLLHIYDDRTNEFDPEVFGDHSGSWYKSIPDEISWNG